jgi:hypothetical protein
MDAGGKRRLNVDGNKSNESHQKNMTQLDPAIYGLAGSIIGGGAVVFGQWLGRRQEENRALTEFAIKTAIENWRQMAEKTDRLKAPHHEYGLNPMDGYLIRTLALVQILRRRKFTPENIQKRMAELDAIGRALQKHLEKKPPSQQSSGSV